MMTFKQFAANPKTIPMSASWYITDLAEAKGKQELFTKQAPRRLKVLREHALIESAVSSNRIEGVNIDKNRIKPVILGRAHLRDRSEEEVRGYRDALTLIHEEGTNLPITGETTLKLHKLTRGEIWDAGKYKEKDGDIIERYPDGSEWVRFSTVRAADTTKFMSKLTKSWDACLSERWVHPSIAIAAFNLDFLCIHPFRDGNGRVSRLLLLLQCYHLGFEAGRYISLERLIERNKQRYYETLEQSSRGWHEGRHDPWPYINYLLFILKEAYKEFEDRLGQITSPRGEKTELVISVINRSVITFSIAEIQKECPGVSLDMIRQILKRLRASGKVECLGRGQSARWQKTDKW